MPLLGLAIRGSEDELVVGQAFRRAQAKQISLMIVG